MSYPDQAILGQVRVKDAGECKTILTAQLLPPGWGCNEEAVCWGQAPGHLLPTLSQTMAGQRSRLLSLPLISVVMLSGTTHSRLMLKLSDVFPGAPLSNLQDSENQFLLFGGWIIFKSYLFFI